MSGKRYAEEFKIEAVKQVVDRGYKVSGGVSHIAPNTLDRQFEIAKRRYTWDTVAHQYFDLIE